MADNPYADLIPGGGGNPYADLIPPHGAGAQMKDFAYQAAGPGFNKGLNATIGLPGAIMAGAGDLAAWGGEKSGILSHETADAIRSGADKFRFKENPVSNFLTSGQEPQTTAGRYGEKIGEFIGGSVAPEAAMFANAGRIASAAKSTGQLSLGQAARNGIIDGGAAIAANPTQAALLSLAGNASAGASSQTAKEAGLGPTAQSIAAIAGGFAPVLGTATLPAKQLATQRGADATADMAAHQELRVRPFGPAFSQGPAASIAKQLSETAVVNAPVRNALEESYVNARDAVGRVAQSMGPEMAHHEIGTAVQGGLDRYRSAGINAIDEAALQRLNIAPSANVPTSRMMSQEASNRAAQADQIRVGQGITPQPINSVTSQRRSAGDLSDAELTSIIRAPSADTSFAAKAEAIYERAWRSIPTLLRSNGSTGNDRLAAVNTRATMDNIQNQVADQIAGQGRINGDLANRLSNGRAHFSLDQLRSIRTEVGRALSNFGIGDARLDRTQLRQLYGALSNDIEVGIMDLANRSRIFSQLPPADPRHVAPDVVTRAETALHQMRQADRFYASGMDRVDNFMRVVGSNTPEGAARSLVTAALGRGRGNINMISTARAALRPEEFNQFSGFMLRSLGEPVGSARGLAQEVGFSVPSFMTRWNNMEPAARTLLFGGEHERAVNNLVRVMTRLSNVEALANHSRTATNMVNTGLVLGGGAAAATGHIGVYLGGLTAGFGLSTLMSQPQWANWAARYAVLRAQAMNSPAVGDRTLARHIGALGMMARSAPVLRPVYDQVSDDNKTRR